MPARAVPSIIHFCWTLPAAERQLGSAYYLEQGPKLNCPMNALKRLTKQAQPQVTLGEAPRPRPACGGERLSASAREAVDTGGVGVIF
jgi:hypothetical protein